MGGRDMRVYAGEKQVLPDSEDADEYSSSASHSVMAPSSEVCDSAEWYSAMLWDSPCVSSMPTQPVASRLEATTTALCLVSVMPHGGQ